MSLSTVLTEVAAERERQELKWGQQDHPSFPATLLDREGGCDPVRMSIEYEIPPEARAKFLLMRAVEGGELTYAHILLEELAEAIGACEDRTEAELRAELVQAAAVAVAWIEAIDRRQGR